MTCVTPGWAMTSRSKRRNPLSPRMSCRMRLPPRPWFMTPIGRPPQRACSRRASWSGHRQKASTVEMLASVSELPTRDDASGVARRQHVDAADEKPVAGHAADRHHGGTREIARGRNIIDLPRVTARYPEIGREVAWQIDADRNVGQGRQSERDRIADNEGTGRDRYGIRRRRSTASCSTPKGFPDPHRAGRSRPRRPEAGGCHRRSTAARAAGRRRCSPGRSCGRSDWRRLRPRRVRAWLSKYRPNAGSLPSRSPPSVLN